MARHTKKEFSVVSGVETKNLSVYIKRGHVVMDGDYIDDTHPKNVLFLEKRRTKTVDKKPESKPKKAPVEKEPDDDDDDKYALVKVDKEKREIAVLRERGALRLQDLEIQKKMGELIPTKSIRGLIIQHSESMKTAYHEISDNLIEIMAQKKGFSAVEVADLRAQNIRLINNAIDSAIETSKKKLVLIVEEYSEKKGVGQHG